MRAVRIHKHGGFDALKYEAAPDPKIEANEVLVQVKACALNHLDLWTRKGIPGIRLPLPIVPGSDVSGVVAEIGSMVQGIKKGDKVLLAPGVSCGECKYCLAGEDNLCLKYEIVGFKRDGGCADFVKIPSTNVLPIPEGLDFVEAAAIPLVFMTAWRMLVTRAQVKPGEDVLVLGGSSGVGSAAIQIAKLFGARVIATGSTTEKILKAQDIGADDVIHHAKKNFQAEVMRLTKKKGVEIVFEHVGPATWDKSILSLARGGRLVTCGATTGPLVKIDLRYLFSNHITVSGSYMGTKAELMRVLTYFPERKLKAVVDRVMEMKDVATAHRFLEERQHFGKVVLIPGKPSKAPRKAGK